MKGRTPEVGDYVEVLVDGYSNSGDNLRAKTPGLDIHLPEGEPGEVLVVKITGKSGYYQARVVERVEEIDIHSLVDYQTTINNLDEFDEKEREQQEKRQAENWVESRKQESPADEKKKPHPIVMDSDDDDDNEDDDNDERENKSPFTDDLLDDKNDLL